MIKSITHINCPATKVFDLMADIRNETRWNTGVSKVDLKSDEPIGKGSQFTVADKRGQHGTTISVFNRPERLEFLMLDEKLDVDIVVDLTETDGQTTVTMTFIGKPKGLMKLIFPLIQPLIKREITKENVNFVRFCEASA